MICPKGGRRKREDEKYSDEEELFWVKQLIGIRKADTVFSSPTQASCVGAYVRVCSTAGERETSSCLWDMT